MSVKRSMLGIPSGALSSDKYALLMKPVKDRTVLNLGGQGYGKEHSMRQAYFTSMTLPEGRTGWHVNAAEKAERKRITEHLKDLLWVKFAGENTMTVTELFRRTDTPGTMAALRFCDRYLTSGGALGDLLAVGKVVLPSNTDTGRLNENNVDDVTRVAVALSEAPCPVKAVPAILELAFDGNGVGVALAALVTERGVFDADTARALLKEASRVPSAVHDGVL